MRADRKVTLVWILAIWTFALFGFGADFARFLHEQPAPPPVLVLHGAFSVAWLALVSTQVVLAETANLALHRRLGWLVVGVSAAMVPFGAVAAMVDMARQVGHPDYAPQFLGEEFQDIFAFAVCTVAGVATRKNRADHSRFMILAALALADVGPGRIATNLVNAAPASPLAVWATFYWGTALVLAGMIAWDLIKHRRVMRATAVGAALLWGGEAIVSVLFFNPAWKSAMAGLVRAWGWTG
jgi:FtsH-binding integral membrane protein